MRKTLLVFEQQADKFRELLEPEFNDLEICCARTREDALSMLPRANAVAVLDTKLDGEMLRLAGKLEWIQTLTTGTDHITGIEGFPAGVTLTSARGIHGPQMSELAFMHMLALLRQFPRMLANQEHKVWERWPQRLLFRKTVAVLGIGAISEEFAKRAKAFDMKVVGISGTARKVPNFDEVVSRDQMAEVLKDADFLVVFIPLTADTTKIVSASTFAAMKPSAFLINLARGGVVDEDALLDALRTKKIAGAGLDVFTDEPLPSESPFWHQENVLISPHVGGFADVIVDQGISVLKTNLRHYLAGQADNFVNVVRPGKLVTSVS